MALAAISRTLLVISCTYLLPVVGALKCSTHPPLCPPWITIFGKYLTMASSSIPICSCALALAAVCSCALVLAAVPFFGLVQSACKCHNGSNASIAPDGVLAFDITWCYSLPAGRGARHLWWQCAAHADQRLLQHCPICESSFLTFSCVGACLHRPRWITIFGKYLTMVALSIPICSCCLLYTSDAADE